MTRLLDTDTCIGVLRQKPGMIARLSQLSPIECAISEVTVYEFTSCFAAPKSPSSPA